MMRRIDVIFLLICLVATTFLIPATGLAEHTRQWRQTDFSDFQKGTSKGVAIRSDGKLLPAPKFEAFADPNLAYLYELRMDSHGRLFAAGGSDAKVLRFDDSGKATTVFESSELAAQAIAFDSKDNLYVGTSPDGKVYKVTPDGQKSVFFDPKTKYIWALRVDSEGFLFVATGDKGEVFMVPPDGKGQRFYQSDERHARSLAFDSKGNLLIGTEPNGLILRVEVDRKAAGKAPSAGASFVIYETDKSEVTSLITDSNGNLYAASVGEKIPIQGIPRIAPIVPTQTATLNINNISAQTALAAQGQAVVNQQPTPYPFPTISGGAEVVKIAADGSPETLWTSREDLVYAIGLTPDGKLLLGTGDKGTIIELEGGQIYSSVAKTASAEVTSFVSGPGGKIFASTANAGKVFTLGPGYEANGSFESNAFDAKIFSQWGRLTWWGEDGVMQGKAAFYARSGNTSNPGDNWSKWAGPYSKSEMSEVSCPPARFVQWKAVFLDTGGARPPSVSWVGIAYQPKNVAPAIDDIALQEPGVRLLTYSAQPSGPGSSVPVQLRMPHGPGANPSSAPAGADSSAKTLRVEVPPQGFEEKGYQAVLWGARDDNDDDLLFSVFYRGESETNWHLLKDKLTQKFYSWDTTSMPDGAYYLKIVATDSPSNPPDRTLSTERQSDRFEIANTPPRIEALRADTASASANVSFAAISSAGPIRQAQYSIDAGDWQIVLPLGHLSDAPNENYRFEISGLTAGEHVVAVQVADGFNNTAAAKAMFTVPAPATR